MKISVSDVNIDDDNRINGERAIKTWEGITSIINAESKSVRERESASKSKSKIVYMGGSKSGNDGESTIYGNAKKRTWIWWNKKIKAPQPGRQEKLIMG